MILSFARDRITQMAEKISFMIALTITSLEDRATRRSYIGVLCQVHIGKFLEFDRSQLLIFWSMTDNVNDFF